MARHSLPLDQISFVTDSDATEDDLPGPGAVVDRVLSRLKPLVERFITRLLARRDCNPDVLITKSLRQIAQSMPSQITRECSHQQTVRDTFLGISTRASFDVIVDMLLSSPALACGCCRDTMVPAFNSSRHISKMCGTLGRMVKDRNVTACAMAIGYVTVLSCLHEELRATFLEAGVYALLVDMERELDLGFRDAELPLLSIVRRARIALSDSTMLLLDEFQFRANTLQKAGMKIDQLEPTAAFYALVDVVGDGLRPLLKMLRRPPDSLPLPVVRYLSAFMWSQEAKWLFMCRSETFNLGVLSKTLWVMLQNSSDAITNALIEQFLYALYCHITFVRSRDLESSVAELLWGPLMDLWKAQPDNFRPGTRSRVVVDKICSTHMVWNLRLPTASVSAMSLPANDSSHPLPDVRGYTNSPISQFVETLFIERQMKRSHNLDNIGNWYGIPRAMPHEKQTMLFITMRKMASMALLKQLDLINAKLFDMQWDIVSRHRLLKILQEDPEVVARQPELVNWLGQDRAYDLGDLQCTGLVIGRVISDQGANVHIYDDHFGDPLPCGRNYITRLPDARLLAPLAGLVHLFWVPWSEIRQPYRPLAMYTGDRDGPHRYIGQFREGGIAGHFHQGGSLLVLDEKYLPVELPWEDWMDGLECGLHVLCVATEQADPPVYWRTPNGCVHALSGVLVYIDPETLYYQSQCRSQFIR